MSTVTAVVRDIDQFDAQLELHIPATLVNGDYNELHMFIHQELQAWWAEHMTNEWQPSHGWWATVAHDMIATSET
jgi:hypothetical protein